MLEPSPEHEPVDKGQVEETQPYVKTTTPNLQHCEMLGRGLLFVDLLLYQAAPEDHAASPD